MSEKKTCTKCGNEKSSIEFYGQIQRSKVSDNVKWRYKDSMCKVCRNAYVNTRRREIKTQAIDYLGGMCVDCGLRSSIVEIYDFHHRNPEAKDFSISDFKNRRIETIKPELDKCDLLCANCHRRRHALVL